MRVPVKYSPLVIADSNRHSPLHLDLPTDLSFEDWLAVGEDLGRADRAINWWIGDWWAFGEHRYGERTTLLKVGIWKGPAFQTCADNAWVCRQFETSRRREVLSFQHHREVAGLSRLVADRLLRWAERNRKSIRELRAEVFRVRNEGERRISPDDGCTVADLAELIAAELEAMTPQQRAAVLARFTNDGIEW